MKKKLIFLLLNTLYINSNPLKILPLYSAPNINICESTGKKENNKEFINLSSIDPITKESFSKLIKQNSKKSLPFILAITKTLVNDKYYHHYFSASELNTWLFGEDHEKDPYDEFEDYNYFNPINGQKINNPILYFKIDSLDSEFKYFCSDKDLFSQDFDSDSELYYQSYIQGCANHKISQSYLGNIYFNKKKYKKAIIWLKNSLSSTECFPIENLVYLADCYYNTQQDSLAFKYYKRAAKKYNNSKAQFKLAQLYENGIGIEQNNYKAAKYYTEAYKNGIKKAKVLLFKLLRNNLDFQPNKKIKTK